MHRTVSSEKTQQTRSPYYTAPNRSKETSGYWLISIDPVTGSQPVTTLLCGPTLQLKSQKEAVETSSPELYFLQTHKHRVLWASDTLLTRASLTHPWLPWELLYFFFMPFQSGFFWYPLVIPLFRLAPSLTYTNTQVQSHTSFFHSPQYIYQQTSLLKGHACNILFTTCF